MTPSQASYLKTLCEQAGDDRSYADEPMTPSQASYLKTLCEQAGDDRSYAEDLSKAEASKRIDALRTELKL
ncbi:DUF3072 domain-containing protein [Mesorhizobium sp. LSHC412B00]|uniref:DUF3072 domain-containing protein n=1 Tax=Mesorhizobium sp. LSHC412B00 TaxID=1287285 RepID=UPI00268D8B72